MRQVLFRVPLDQPWSLGPLGEVPGFGFGLVLALWVLFGAWWLYRRRGEIKGAGDLLGPAVVWGILAAVIVMVPSWSQRESRQAIAGHTAAITSDGSGSRVALHYDRRALAYLAMRDYAHAAEDLRRAIEADPDYGPAYQHLAWLLATAPPETIREGEEALRLARTAMELGGEPSAVDLDILAAAAAEAGQYESAVETAKQAARAALNADTPQERGRLPDIRRRLWTYTQKSAWVDVPPGRSVPVYGYGFMLFLAFLFSGWDAQRRASRVGVPPEAIWDFAMWMLIAGVVGARLFYVVQYREQVFRNANTLGDKLFALVNLPDGGLTLLGGILLAVAVAYLFCGVRKIPRHLMGDIVMPSLLLGMAFGRLGCLMNGCCWGDACELPWAIQFPVGSVPDRAMVERGFTAPGDPLVLPLHPTQIYSAISNFLLYALLSTLFWFRRRDGQVLAAAMLLYAVARFVVEYLRSDEALVVMTLRTFLFWGTSLATFTTPFTISQWICIALFAGGLLYAWFLHRGPRTVTRPQSPSVRTEEVGDDRLHVPAAG